MYYVCDSYDGYKNSSPALHWRIRAGIDQEDTALTVATNLALTQRAYEGVKDVDFVTEWGLGHTTAERSGSSTEKFIDWVNACVNERLIVKKKPYMSVILNISFGTDISNRTPIPSIPVS